MTIVRTAPHVRLLAAAPWVIGIAVTLLLLAVSARYGFHRDEFYYLVSGRHPAWGYVDNPPLTPALARWQAALFGVSPTALRVVPALAIGLCVVITGRIARELGGDRVAAAVTAACTAGAAFPLATGHMLSTSTIDVLVWTALSWLLVRALRDGGRVWLAVGLVAGVGLLNKSLVAAFLGVVAVGVLAVGPRRVFRDPWLWGAAVLALAVWAPHLVWQAAHGWPQLAFGQQIATVGNGGSEPRWTFPLFQLIEVSPFLVPVWVAGLWRLVRDPAVAHARAFAVAYGLLFVLLLAAGGKHYYLAGLYPVLLAAGAVPVVAWMRRARARARLVTAVLVANAVVVAWLMLPIVPVRSLPGSPQVAVSPIPAETVGWPAFVATVADVSRGAPPGTVVLAGNYGEAGAVDVFRDDLGAAGLPPAYSGQNSYADWGPPPESATTVVAVGYDEATLRRWFADVRVVTRIENEVGVDNEERGAPVAVASGRRDTWAALWPRIRRLA
ncbi:4-amino-4-deoxy-L-arabinose transferase-like glycosyltransferase [Actinomycetospora succinea]|uniref:4-amino-4-deoxy-L-arabinose transferase-like glycosyltransferase n=1 Tax=Actinomycetospora succinea TaxID=663603 RepID=A0A4R6VPK9_9PSEU|nr:glycosyltransferase family 39 protein [Actinomycetospora succinea]TDQ65852.1 4-amino-4-deoxy-L-arabinose transferase-like glycosyltransferase [Actinomycetospora succinea]